MKRCLAALFLLCATLVIPIAASAPASASAPTSGTAVCGTSTLTSPYTTAPNPLDGTTSTVSVPTGQNMTFNFSTPDTTYWFKAGTHYIGTGTNDSIGPANGDVYVGAPGAILNGQFDNQYAFADSATPVWIEYLTIKHFAPGGGAGAVNGSAAQNWTMEYNTIEDNAPGYGVYAGSGNVLDYNCITLNGQGGFGTYTTLDTSALTGGGQNVTVDYNEISYNDTCNWEAVSPDPVPSGDIQSTCAGAGQYNGCGCSGAGKFWQDYGSDLVGNYIHNDFSTGVWWDTDNEAAYVEGNYISNEWDSAIIFEISQNATITDNTFVIDEWGSGAYDGAQQADFPIGTIFLNNAGGNTAVHTPASGAGSLSTSGKMIVSDNVFTDDWGTVVAWADAGRFCGNVNSNPYPLCVPPANNTTFCTPGQGSCATGCSQTTLTGATHNEPSPDYYDRCMWFTNQVSVTGNTFTMDSSMPSSCTTGSPEYCGAGGLFATCGCGGDGPSWNPYTNEEANIVKANSYENNSWTDNSYTYTGSVPFTFFWHDQSQVLSSSTWQTDGQDSGSTFAT